VPNSSSPKVNNSFLRKKGLQTIRVDARNVGEPGNKEIAVVTAVGIANGPCIQRSVLHVAVRLKFPSNQERIGLFTAGTVTGKIPPLTVAAAVAAGHGTKQKNLS